VKPRRARAFVLVPCARVKGVKTGRGVEANGIGKNKQRRETPEPRPSDGDGDIRASSVGG
jgi:hypothetical protein